MTNPTNIGCRIFGHSTVKQPNTIASIKNVFLGPKSVISAIFAVGPSFVKISRFERKFRENYECGSPPLRAHVVRYREEAEQQLPQSQHTVVCYFRRAVAGPYRGVAVQNVTFFFEVSTAA